MDFTISEALVTATRRLAEAGIEEPRREASSLTAFATGRDRAFLIAHPEYRLTSSEADRFAAALERRAGREPLQYIVGKQEFFGLEFKVTPDVLIPRPETELIVEAAIAFLRGAEQPSFCDVGTGSGCIPVAVLANVPQATAVALDVSEAALEVACLNARTNLVDDRLGLRVSDVFEALRDAERFDAILSNPPYVNAAEVAGLQPEVREFEPRGALTDEADGLSVVARVIAGAPAHLRPGGLLLIEIGAGQSDAVRLMIDREVWNEPAFINDLQGIERTLSVTLRRPA